MYYTTEYELCSLFFLLAVTVRFFSMRKFPSKQNRLFGLILYCAIADLALDILCSYLTAFPTLVPHWVLLLLSSGFYALQIILPALLLVYAQLLAGRWSFKRCAPFLFPAFLLEGLLLINPFTRIIFTSVRRQVSFTIFTARSLTPSTWSVPSIC